MDLHAKTYERDYYYQQHRRPYYCDGDHHKRKKTMADYDDWKDEKGNRHQSMSRKLNKNASILHPNKDDLVVGVKVLHNELDEVMIKGGEALVLTLKDHSILSAHGDEINDEVDILQCVAIREQKQRDDAYKAARTQKTILLLQYDAVVEEDGDGSVVLDENGRFTGKKLPPYEDLSSSANISSDYYTRDEVPQFKKSKKKKSLRKRDKLDLDVLEAEAISAGLGVGNLGSRKDRKTQTAKEEHQRSEAQQRSDTYQSAFVKAEEASKALRQELLSTTKVDRDENLIFGDEDEDYYRSLEMARRLTLKKQDGATSGPQEVASLAPPQTPLDGETRENKVVFTEIDKFVWGLHLNKKTYKIEGTIDEPRGGWPEVNDNRKCEHTVHEVVVPDDIVHKVAVGKGLSGALQLLQVDGTLKQTNELGGRNMNRKESKLVGGHKNDGAKEIHIQRLDKFGREMTPGEAFKVFSHKFHGKQPGKNKCEKRTRQYEQLHHL